MEYKEIRTEIVKMIFSGVKKDVWNQFHPGWISGKYIEYFEEKINEKFNTTIIFEEEIFVDALFTPSDGILSLAVSGVSTDEEDVGTYVAEAKILNGKIINIIFDEA
jgi:hypothetical protein